MFKSAAGIVGWVNVNTFHLTGKFLFQSFEGKEVVAKNEVIIEDVFFAGAVFGMVAFSGIFQQDTWFQPGAVFLADPG
jgi:hypothetical protein